jgi:hypothetical protein
MELFSVEIHTFLFLRPALLAGYYVRQQLLGAFRATTGLHRFRATASHERWLVFEMLSSQACRQECNSNCAWRGWLEGMKTGEVRTVRICQI